MADYNHESSASEVDSWDATEAEVLKTYNWLPDRHIRLLRLLPGKDDQVVSCYLVVVSLDSNPRYEAISYAWGKSANMIKMSLNGKLCWRKHNLLECLDSFRDVTETRDLWVDALCINQADTKEKSAQINLMPHIYRQATRTLIWLGKDAYYLLPSIPSPAPLAAPGRPHPGPKYSDALQLLDRLAQNEHLSFTHHFAELVWGLRLICEFEWWSRVWVVQETLLSKSAGLVLGKSMLPWGTALRAASNIVRHSSTCCHGTRRNEHEKLYEGLIRDGLSVCAEVVLSFRPIPPGTNNELLANLWIFRNRIATLDHDKVYGLLGMLELDALRIQPDYTISFARLCRSVTLEDIRLSGNLHALMGVRERSRPAGFSSWCIEWNSLDYWAADRSRILTGLYKQIYQASSTYIPRLSTYIMPGLVNSKPNEKYLSVAGMLFGRVAHVGSSLRYQSEILEDQRMSHDAASISLRYLQSCYHDDDEPYIAGGSVFNAFWRTLIGDCITPYHDSHIAFGGLQLGNQSGREPSIRRARAVEFWAFLVWWFNETYMESAACWRTERKPVNVQMVQNVKASIVRATTGRRIFVTEEGYLGLGPDSIERGDRVAILIGGSTPFVLKCVQDSHRFIGTLKGDCYVHGCMDGELVKNEDIDKWDMLTLL